MASFRPSTTLTLSAFVLFAAVLTPAFSKPHCRPGTFRSGPVCKPCPAGSYQWLAGQTSCTPCPANTYTSFTGVVDQTLCLPCPPDAFSKPGQSTCTSCPAGRVRDANRPACRKRTRRDAPACKKGFVHSGHTYGVTYGSRCQKALRCPKGFVAPPMRVYFPTDVCISGRTGCPRGTTFHSWVRQPLCKRAGKIVCQKGSRFDGKDRCLSCPTGMRQRYNAAEKRWQCAVCTGLSVSPGGLSKRCVPCKNRTFPSLDGSACVRKL